MGDEVPHIHEYLLGFTMNVLSTPIALSLFIATVKIFQISDDRVK